MWTSDEPTGLTQGVAAGHVVGHMRPAHDSCYQFRLRGVPTMMQPPGTGIMRKLVSSS